MKVITLLLIFTFLVSCIKRAEDTSELHMPATSLPVIVNNTPSEKTTSLSANRLSAHHQGFYNGPVASSGISPGGLPYRFYAPVLSSDSLPFSY